MKKKKHIILWILSHKMIYGLYNVAASSKRKKERIKQKKRELTETKSEWKFQPATFQFY